MKCFRTLPKQSLILFSILIGLCLLGMPASANEYGHDSPHHGKYSKGHDYGHSEHSYSRYGHMGPHQSASQFIEHILKFKQAMAITDDQEKQLQSINNNYKKTQIKMKADVELANLDLHELLRNDQASLSDIESKLKKVHVLKAELLMASIKAKREAKSVFTDEQRQRMKAVHERIQQYGSGSMSKEHPCGDPHHAKSHEKESM